MPARREVTVEWCGGRHFESKSQSGTLINLDASPEHGGQNAGAQPMELLLISLAGCTGMDVISILEKKRQQVTRFQIRVEGVRQDDHPRVYREVTITYRVTGHQIDPNAVARAIELSVTKYCPLYATISQTATMHTRYEVLEAE
ncbi:MAG: OsmC family peroxiredoxin [Nitrospinota bacterium]|nr:MAG: OsmC family peroxiredoxin [Nitrospinota bacterium]